MSCGSSPANDDDVPLGVTWVAVVPHMSIAANRPKRCDAKEGAVKSDADCLPRVRLRPMVSEGEWSAGTHPFQEGLEAFPQPLSKVLRPIGAVRK